MYSYLLMLSHIQFLATTWTVTHQAPLSMGFSRQEYWSGWPCPPPGDLPDLGIEPVSLKSPALADRFFTTSATALWWKKFQFTKEASVHTVSRNTVSNPPKGSGKVTV